jgi:general secretion pathway protein A
MTSPVNETAATEALSGNEAATAESITPVLENVVTIKSQEDFKTQQAVSASADVTHYDDIEQILNDANNNQTAAFQQLFKTWNRTYDDQSKITACKQAEKFSLSCLYRNGNLNSLKKHNRPAVLTLLNDQGESRYITIASLNDSSATILAHDSTYTVKLSDLDRYWYGQFTLLWQKPEHYSSPITPGASGYMVNWLYSQLTKIDNDSSADMIISSYDDYLIAKVKALQLQQGLHADGIVGPITIIHINTLSGMKVPTLAPAPMTTNKPSSVKQG